MRAFLFFRCNMEREKCKNANPELTIDYDGECNNDDDDIEFEAIEADEEGHSEDPGCSGRLLLCISLSM